MNETPRFSQVKTCAVLSCHNEGSCVVTIPVTEHDKAQLSVCGPHYDLIALQTWRKVNTDLKKPRL